MNSEDAAPCLSMNRLSPRHRIPRTQGATRDNGLSRLTAGGEHVPCRVASAGSHGLKTILAPSLESWKFPTTPLTAFKSSTLIHSALHLTSVYWAPTMCLASLRHWNFLDISDKTDKDPYPPYPRNPYFKRGMVKRDLCTILYIYSEAGDRELWCWMDLSLNLLSSLILGGCFNFSEPQFPQC